MSKGKEGIPVGPDWDNGNISVDNNSNRLLPVDQTGNSCVLTDINKLNEDMNKWGD